jgi:hypothetical protein
VALNNSDFHFDPKILSASSHDWRSFDHIQLLIEGLNEPFLCSKLNQTLCLALCYVNLQKEEKNVFPFHHKEEIFCELALTTSN